MTKIDSNKTCSKERNAFETLLVSVDTSPWDAIYRAAIGFAIPLTVSRLWGEDALGWASVALLLGVLFMLRAFPAAFRRSAPFSGTVQSVWAERRRLAKRYDSYQWRKLFWIGVGFALYTALSGRFMISWIAVSLFCLLSGAFGLVRWRHIQNDFQRMPMKQAQRG
jgi:hypothetical protein